MRKLSRRLWWLIAAVIAVPLLVYVGLIARVFLPPTVDDYTHRLPFDAVAWRDRSEPADFRWPNRLRMVDDLIARKLLDGRARPEVVALLGPADETAYFKDWHLVYFLGPERGPFGVDSEWLVIRIRPDGRVGEYRLVTD